MQIIIVGCGKVGATLTEQLSQEGHNVSVIDQKSEVVQNISTIYDVRGIIGNGASYTTQMDADIEKADLLIAVTHSDELNLLCCLIARKAGNCSTIARVRNPVYRQEINFIKEELGLSMVINPEYAAAMEVSRILRFPSAIEIDTFAKGRVELLKFRIPVGSPLHNIVLQDISSKFKCDVLVCVVERDGEVIIPRGDFRLQEKDTISIVTSPKLAANFFKRIGVVTNQVKNTILVGGGELAYYLARQLLDMGIGVKIIEQKKERCEILSDLLPRAIIINGDGTSEELLMEEGLATAESFVALTNFDEENILLSLFAGSSSNAKTITKINRINFGKVVKSLDLGTVIHPKYITAEYILQYVRAMQNSVGSNVETLYQIIENKVEALEFWIHSDRSPAGIPIQELNLKKNLLISCINRNGRIIIPRGQDIIQKGDTVVVVTSNRGLKDIRDILKD